MAKITAESTVISALEQDILTVCDGNSILSGAQILQAINTARQLLNFEILSAGSLYTTLNRMVEQELLISRGERGDRIYSISDQGRKALQETIAFREGLKAINFF